MVQAFSVPIKLTVGVRKKKAYYLNLNNYRNWQFQLSNQLKKSFKISIAKEVRKLKPVKKCQITYSIYYPTARLFDIGNIGSIISKFTEDALVEFGVLADDNYTIIPKVITRYGGRDKDNPRCDVIIQEIKDE